MADFNLYYPKLIKHEGGYVNDPSDKGGETYRGIARVHNPTWDGWNIIDKKPKPIKVNTVFPELESNVKAFYKKKYWDNYSYGNIANQSIAEFLADFTINGAPKTAIKNIQTFVSANPDGAFGKDTASAINKYPDQGKLFNYIFDKRKKHYENIVASNPTQQKFYNGWMNRIKSFAYDNKTTIKTVAGTAFFFWILAGLVAFLIYKSNKK